jgi:nucleotide-binding universal stress UspA family protein
MSFRDIVVILRPQPAGTSEAAVEYAATMAMALDARVSAIACAVLPKVPQRLLGNALLDVSAMATALGRKSEADAKKLLTTFEQVMVAKQGRIGEVVFLARRSPEVPEALVDFARLRDLSILPMPEGDYISNFDAQWYAEAIIFESGHPILVLPQKRTGAGPIEFGSVLVAWDKSRAAARAIADAMPILEKARRVRLLTVAGEKQMPSERPNSELAKHLETHGVKAVVDEVDAAGRAIGEVLTKQAAAHQCDLIVMGAYGRSRLREFVLGGATKSMLTHPPAPLFLSH